MSGSPLGGHPPCSPACLGQLGFQAGGAAAGITARAGPGGPSAPSPRAEPPQPHTRRQRGRGAQGLQWRCLGPQKAHRAALQAQQAQRQSCRRTRSRSCGSTLRSAFSAQRRRQRRGCRQGLRGCRQGLKGIVAPSRRRASRGKLTPRALRPACCRPGAPEGKGGRRLRWSCPAGHFPKARGISPFAQWNPPYICCRGTNHDPAYPRDSECAASTNAAASAAPGTSRHVCCPPVPAPLLPRRQRPAARREPVPLRATEGTRASAQGHGGGSQAGV